MRRAARILFNTAAALSVLLCVATGALWVRSYFVSDCFIFRGFEDEGDRTYNREDIITCGRGGLGMNRVVVAGQRHWSEARHASLHYRTETAEYPFHRFDVDVAVWGGFKRGAFTAPVYPGHARPLSYAWQVVVPLWAVLAPVAMFPALWAWRWRRLRKRYRAGLCPTCNYDLRATPDRCPECGKVFTAAAAPHSRARGSETEGV